MSNKKADEQTVLLKKLLIVQMGLAGVPQLDIRKIVGGSVQEVNDIVSLLRKPSRVPGKGVSHG